MAEKAKKKKVKKENFIQGVRKEMALVSWPTRKNVLKYTVATLIFILFVTGFFLLLNALMAVITGGN